MVTKRIDEKHKNISDNWYGSHTGYLANGSREKMLIIIILVIDGQ